MPLPQRLAPPPHRHSPCHYRNASRPPHRHSPCHYRNAPAPSAPSFPRRRESRRLCRFLLPVPSPEGRGLCRRSVARYAPSLREGKQGTRIRHMLDSRLRGNDGCRMCGVVVKARGNDGCRMCGVAVKARGNNGCRAPGGCDSHATVIPHAITATPRPPSHRHSRMPLPQRPAPLRTVIPAEAGIQASLPVLVPCTLPGGEGLLNGGGSAKA